MVNIKHPCFLIIEYYCKLLYFYLFLQVFKFCSLRIIVIKYVFALIVNEIIKCLKLLLILYPKYKRMSAQFSFFIDRGGTFTDIYTVVHDGTSNVVSYKILSNHQAYKNSASEGIRRVLEENLKTNIPYPIPLKYIKSIKMGTTVGTNALLERKGAKVGVLITKGFKDLIRIGD